MKYAFFLVVALISLLISSGNAQTGTTIIKEFGADSLINTGKSVIQLNSGSIFYAGYAQDSLSNWLIQFHKLDANADLIFSRYFEGPSGQGLMERMKLHPDGTLIISGTDIDSLNNSQPLLMKVDTNGNVIWKKTYGNGISNGSLLGLSIHPDGSILASGFTTDLGFPFIGFLCIRTDADGNPLLNKVFSDPSAVSTSDACTFTSDYDMILSGDLNTGTNRYSAHIIKSDTSGNTIWEATVGTRLNGGCKNLWIDSNNDLLVIGECATDSSSNFDIQLSKLDIQSGLFKWTKFIRSSNESDAGFSILETSDHHYLITGYGYDTSENRKRVVMILTDSSGNELKKQYYGSGLANIGFDINPSTNGQYLVAGGNFTTGKNILIMDDPASWSFVQSMVENKFQIYPSVLFSGELLCWTNSAEKVEIMDQTGKTVYSGSGIKTNLNTSFLSKGVYYFFTTVSGHRYSARFIIQ